MLALLTAFAACQPTPEGDVILNKGEGVLEEKIAASPQEPQVYEAPDTLVLEPLGWTQGQVLVDAQVEVPDRDCWPVQEIRKKVFTDSWAAEILNLLFDGNPVYETQDEISATRPQILEEIQLLQELIANVDADWPESSEEEKADMVQDWQEELERWQELYKTASETFEGRRIDPVSSSFAGWTSLYGQGVTGEGYSAHVEISRYANNLHGISVTYTRLDEGTGRAEYFDMDSDLTNLNGVSVSREEAEEMAVAFMEKLGEEGFAPAVVRAAYCDPNGKTEGGIENWPQAYYVLLTRTVNGAPTTYRALEVDYGAQPLAEAAVSAEPATTPSPGPGETSSSGWEPETTSDPSSRSYTPADGQEYVEMLVRDSGVVYMYWREASETGEILNENVELLPFEEMVSRFKSQISYASAFAGEGEDILQVDCVKLGMMQVRKRDAQDTYLMLPVWAFYRKREENGDGIVSWMEADEEIVLLLNAIDGSVVDLVLGY